MHNKGREYMDSQNERTEEYQSTPAGMMALRAGASNTLARMRGANTGGSHRLTAGCLINVWCNQNGVDFVKSKCYLCGKVSEWEIDHAIPIADGGHHRGNVVLVCENCHKKKTAEQRDPLKRNGQAILFTAMLAERGKR
jgi:hypothetical protein